MRIVIATLIGGLIMFFWGAFAHMVLPLGELSMRAPTNEDAVLTALRDGLPPEHGIYLLPHFDMATMHGNDQAMKAYSEKAKANPYAFIVYSPNGKDPLAMGGNLFHQWLSDTLAALMVVLVMMRMAGVGLLRGLWIGLAFGVFSWLSLSVPYWNWYRFPGAFTAGYLVEQGFGWLLAGAAMGWWLGRKSNPSAVKPMP
ncbi:hypothetical protein [Luteibacter yeojuensis]|uniref:Uncharacterized protein n=1 Tax=Luteibacter yeojuensis TaxID=345309 RepID=A0A7X5QS94_9GAMM|nr:hypothetical protein [Luteibacter yeojuensis]NID14488.1 hypothetical protein [Luteibacter yeojuensis]